MIIATRTAYSLTRLLLNSLAAGSALYLLYLLLVLFPAILKCANTVNNGFTAFRQSIAAYKSNKTLSVLCDFTICTIAACTACVLLFLDNNGQFRLIAVAASGLGFYCSKSVLSRPLSFLTAIIAFVLLKILFIVSFPAVWLIRLQGEAIRRILKKARNMHRLSLMRKYTKEKFDKLDALTELGLLDNGYKELIK